MNMYLWRRLGFLFALLCVTAVASHPGAALSKTTTPKTAAPAAVTTGAASTATTDGKPADDHSAAAPAVSADDDFNDEPEADRHDRLDSRSRLAARTPRHRSYADSDNNIVSIGHSSHLQSGEKAESVVSVFGSSTSEGEAVDV